MTSCPFSFILCIIKLLLDNDSISSKKESWKYKSMLRSYQNSIQKKTSFPTHGAWKVSKDHQDAETGSESSFKVSLGKKGWMNKEKWIHLAAIQIHSTKMCFVHTPRGILEMTLSLFTKQKRVYFVKVTIFIFMLFVFFSSCMSSIILRLFFLFCESLAVKM